MHSRVFFALFAFVVGSVFVLPAPTAEAHHTRPPFEITFPQEIDATTFSNTWYDRRPGGRRHRGTDLIAPRLTEVYAVADGVVDRVKEDRTSGRSLRIAHGNGWTSHYVHLNNDYPGTDNGYAPWSMTLAPGVEEGRAVKKGQMLGWVGDSGNAEDTIPHTHFEFRINGRSINPYYALKDAYETDVIKESRMESLMARRLPDYVIE